LFAPEPFVSATSCNLLADVTKWSGDAMSLDVRGG
jgi:hypothetical protein